MPTQTYILQKPSGYYFRFKFPEDIRFFVKKTELRYSLQTRSIELAKSKARLMAGKVQHIIRKIRRGSMTKLTVEQINGLISKYILNTLDTDEVDRTIDDSPHDPSFQEDHVKILGMISDLFKNKLATKDKTFIESTLDEFLKEQGVDADKDSMAYKKLYRDMLKADAHIFEIMKKRQQGDYSDEIMPEFVQSPPALPQAPVKVSKTISQVMVDFFEEGNAEKRWTPKTKGEIKASIQVLIDYFGDVPVNSIDRKLMGQYKRDIMKLPPSMKLDKRYRDLTIHEILKLKPKKTIAIHTINKLLGRANSLFEYARINGEILLNPAEGMNVKKTKRADEEREIFTQDDLKAIFNSDQYTMDKFSRSYMYWSPILAAFTGARQEEICSLRLTDFEQHEGIWCINIVTDEDKTLKNLSSRRLVPLHPFLVEDLGIIRMVEELKQRKKTHFMHDLNPHGGRYGVYVSRWFNERYKKSVGITNKVFHSFRHTFGTNLSHNGINDHSLKTLMGHSEGSITFGTYVKRGTPTKLLKDLVNNLDYGLDLEHLKNSKYTG